MTILDCGWDEFFWLVKVEAAMRVHRATYPFDRNWRRWIRTQSLSPAWFEGLSRNAQAVLDGHARTFADSGAREGRDG